MKKITLLAVIGFISINHSFAQDFGELSWQKKKIPAVITEVPQSSSSTEDAIRNKFSQLGYNAKSTKGVYEYKGIRISEISNETFDVLLNVERKSRKDKDKSIVYFAISRGNDNYIKGDDDAELVAKIKQYCLNFIPWAEAQALEEEIKQQEDKVKSVEKKLRDYNDDADNLQKKKKKIEDDIEQNIKDIEKQKEELENQKKALENLKNKRKN